MSVESPERLEVADPAHRPLTLYALLHPREQTPLVVLGLVTALTAAWWTHAQRGWLLWQSVALFLVVMTAPAVQKWRADRHRFGTTVTVVGVLVTVQSLHSVEHGFQWWQRHVLGLPLRQSNGLLSPANSEWVHFVWNWGVVVAVVFLIVRGMRNPFAWLLLVWASAHTFEHTYMWVRYLQVLDRLADRGITTITAQGLPGIVGNDGWLERNGSVFCPIVKDVPFITTATRLDTHFVWNVVEVALLLPAAAIFLRRFRVPSTLPAPR